MEQSLLPNMVEVLGCTAQRERRREALETSKVLRRADVMLETIFKS